MSGPLPNPAARRERQLDRAATAVLVLLVALLTRSFWAPANLLPYGRGDADHFQELSYCRTLGDSFRQQGEYPLWTPYFGGGFPFAGGPGNPGISPYGLLCIAFPEVVAVRLLAAACLLMGVCGMQRSSREWLGMSPGPALLAAFLYGAAAWYPGRLLSGNFQELPLFTLPLVWLALLRLLQRRWLGLALPLLYSLLWSAKFGGFVVAATVLWLAWCYRDAVGVRARSLLVWWSASFACGVALGLHRFLPMLDVLARDLLQHAAFVATRGYSQASALLGYLLPGGEQPNLWLGVGWGALGLACAGVAFASRRAWPLVVTTLGAALFALGPRSPIPLWELATRLPLLDAMRPAKYVNGLIPFGVCALAGLGAEAGLRWVRPRLAASTRLVTASAGVAAVLGFIAIAGEPIRFSARIHGRIFTFEDFDARPEDFHHTASRQLAGRLERHRGSPPELLELNQYYNMRRNVGTITWAGGLVLPEDAIPRYFADRRGRRHDNPRYSGELHCEPPSCAVDALVARYNTLSFRVANDRPARAVLNFNHDAGWHSSEGTVVRQDGLLAIALPAGAERRVHLRFRSARTVLGFWIGGIAVLAWTGGVGAWLATRRRAAVAAGAAGGSDGSDASGAASASNGARG